MNSAPQHQAQPSVSPHFTVIIPAHNEAAVIADCLNAIRRGAPPGAGPEIIVVANGCTDQTVRIARQVAPEARVLELAEGSKPKAINLGLRSATVWPCFVLDADIVVDYLSLAATANVLIERKEDIDIAGPALRVDLAGADLFIHSYYAVWMTQPYIRNAMVGSGIYGLTREAHDRIGDMPDVFGDDEWFRTRFPPERRCSLTQTPSGDPVFFVVRPPRTVFAHIAVEARRTRAKDEVRSRFPSDQTIQNNRVSNLADARASGATILDILIYVAMKVASRTLMRIQRWRGSAPVWNRDPTNRAPGQ